MIQTIEAVVDPDGGVRLLGEIHITGSRRAFVTVLDEPTLEPREVTLLAEAALSDDWTKPEEEEAWSYLQGGK